MAPGKFDQFWAARYPAEQTASSSFWSSVADRPWFEQAKSVFE
jgi:hypothetical protein